MFDKNQLVCICKQINFAVTIIQGAGASVGLYIDCGSIYETPESSGASHLLEQMAFKSTTNRSHLRLVREVEAIGGSVSASVSHEQMCYTYDAFKAYVPEMVEVLIDSVRNPAFFDWEVKEQVLRYLKATIMFSLTIAVGS
jgi:mitochondrial-processing peptidase subunit alpha